LINTLVIVPTYNEVDNIQKFIDSVFLIDGLSLLVVDDNSPDGTAKIVESNFENYQNLYLIKREGKLGLGSAYIEGFKWFLNSNYSNCLQMDGDFSHSFNDLKGILDNIFNADLIIGSRYTDGGSTVGWSIERRLLSKYANILSRTILRSKINDLTGGFNLLSREVVSEIINLEPSSNGYTFLMEVKNLIEKKGFKIKEVPITFVERESGKSKMNNQIVVEAIKFLLKNIFKKI
tara:strand:- start:3248 stop:3949 length:702 start_codon:yes stop_codon:yes gene_type:complete